MPKPRNPQIRTPLKTLSIFCEGEKTEPIYINGYLKMFGSNERKSVILVEQTRKNTAVQLVQAAAMKKESPNALPIDEYWVVYDRESPKKYSDELHAKAKRIADQKGIKIAISNVCFEYWILLHFCQTDAPYESYDDLHKNSQLEREIKSACGEKYSKSSYSVFDAIKHRIAEARIRGKRINESGKAAASTERCQTFHINPYMGMVDLLDAIDDFK